MGEGKEDPGGAWKSTIGLEPASTVVGCCGQPLKWVGGGAWGSDRESGLGLSSLAAPPLVPLPGAADSVIRISIGLAAEGGSQCCPKSRPRPSRALGTGCPGCVGPGAHLAFASRQRSTHGFGP